MSNKKSCKRKFIQRYYNPKKKDMCGSCLLIVILARGSFMFNLMIPRLPLKYQNSYRLFSKNPFNKEHVEAIMKGVMDSHFLKIDRFDSRLSAGHCRTITDEIIELVKEKKYDRFEFSMKFIGKYF